MPDKYLDRAQKILNLGLSSVGTFKHCIRKVSPQNFMVTSINKSVQMEKGSVYKHKFGCKKSIINFERMPCHNVLQPSLLLAVTSCNS
jgi:hypothetical protein